jgi:hypothetical protein
LESLRFMPVYTWTGGADTNGANNWITPANWLLDAVPASSFPNSPTDDAIVNTDDGTKDAIISGGQSIAVASLSIGDTGHVIVGGSADIGGGGGGTLTSTGAIAVTSTNAGGGLVGGTATTITAPTLSIGAGAIIGGGGTFDIAALANLGMIQADGGPFGLGTLAITGGTITGTGSIEVDGASGLELGSATAEQIAVNVAPADTATIILDDPVSFTGGLNLVNADSHVNLFFKNQTPTGATFDNTNQTLVITDAGGTIDTIPFASNGTVSFSTPTSTLAGYGEVSIGDAAPANFTVFDTTTNTTTTAAGDAYNGPVAGLQHQFTSLSTDSLNITSVVPNAFIHTGSGDDGIDVSHANGANILDGGTGSTFMTGGTGNDIFYMDARETSAAPVFSSILNFHSGDNATVWGVNATDFKMLTLNNQGASGYTGLDLVFSAPGHIDTSFVLTGYTSADLTNGKLSMSYGTTPDAPGVPGSQYFTVHAT